MSRAQLSHGDRFMICWYRLSALLLSIVATGCSQSPPPHPSAEDNSPVGVEAAAVQRETSQVESSPDDAPVKPEEPKSTKASAPPRDFDFAELAAGIREHGIEWAIERSEASSDENQRKLALALRHVQPFVEEDPDQLWFQLQGRTRLKSWVDFQAVLRRQTPADMLVAESSDLDSVHPGIERSWQLTGSHKNPIAHVAMSRDGTELYCGTSEGDFVVIDPGNLKTVRRLTQVGRVLATTTGPDAKDIFVSSGHGRKGISPGSNEANRIAAYDVRDGSHLVGLSAARPTHGFLGMIPMPPGIIGISDGRELLVPGEGSAFTIVPVDGSMARGFKPTSRVDVFARPFFCVTRDDGKSLFTVDTTGVVRFFSLPDGNELQPPQLAFGGLVSSCALNRAGNLLAICRVTPVGNRKDGGKTPSGEVAVWDIEKQEVVFQRSVRDQALVSVAFVGEEETVATGTERGNLLLWKEDSEKPINDLSLSRHALAHLVVALDNRHLFVGDGGGSLKLVDPWVKERTGEPLPASALPLAVSRDGKRDAVVSQKKLRIRDADTRKIIAELDLKSDSLKPLGSIRSVALDVPDKTILIGGTGALARWNLDTSAAEMIPLDLTELIDDRPPGADAKRPLPPVIVSPEGRHVAVWSTKILANFDPATGVKRFSLKTNVRHFNRQYAFLKDGDRLLIDYQGFENPGARIEGLRLFNLAEGKEVADLVHGAFQTGIGFMPDLNQVVTSGRLKHGPERDNPPVAILRNLDSGESDQFPLPEGHDYILGATPDGARLLTMRSKPARIYLWDFPARTVIRRFDLDFLPQTARFDGHTATLTEMNSKRRYVFRLQR